MMTTTGNPVEAALYRVYWDDGLLDILAGVGVLLVGIGWLFDQVVLAAILPGLLVPLWEPLRRRVVEPRAGYVRFARERQDRTRRGLGLSVVLGVVLLAAGLALFFGHRLGLVSPLSQAVVALPAALLALLAVMTAGLTGAHRFQLYACALLLAGGVAIALQAGPAAPMIAGGLVMLLSGFLLLARFIREAAEHVDDGRA